MQGNTMTKTAADEMRTMFEQLSESNQNNALCVLRSLVFAQSVTDKSAGQRPAENRLPRA